MSQHHCALLCTVRLAAKAGQVAAVEGVKVPTSPADGLQLKIMKCQCHSIIYIYTYIRRPRQTQGGVRQGIRHSTLVSDYYHYRVEMHIASIASSRRQK